MGASKDFYTAIQENIRLHSQHLIGVFSTTDEEIPFVYTIGNHGRGLPELLLIGGCQGAFAAALNELGEMMRARGQAFRNGELVSIGGKYPLKIIDASVRARNEFTIQAGVFYKTDDYRVQQVLLPDQQGRFPDEDGCAEPYASMPVLAPPSLVVMASDRPRSPTEIN